MAEAGQTSETPQIPPHWQISKRFKSPEIIQVDEDQSFLTFKDLDIERKPAFNDYLFRRDGLPQMGRAIHRNGFTFVLNAGGAGAQYLLIEPAGTRRGLIAFFGKLRRELALDPEWFYSSLDGSISYSSRVVFEGNGTLDTLTLDRDRFDDKNEGGNEPAIKFTNNDGSLEIKDWENSYEILWGQEMIPDPDKPNKLVYVNNKGNQFIVEWDNIDESGSDSNKISYFVVTQTNVVNGEQKIIKSPFSYRYAGCKSCHAVSSSI